MNLVIEHCGAIPDFEDREGEVCGLIRMAVLLTPRK
jgi:hypothetical protein